MSRLATSRSSDAAHWLTKLMKLRRSVGRICSNARAHGMSINAVRIARSPKLWSCCALGFPKPRALISATACFISSAPSASCRSPASHFLPASRNCFANPRSSIAARFSAARDSLALAAARFCFAVTMAASIALSSKSRRSVRSFISSSLSAASLSPPASA